MPGGWTITRITESTVLNQGATGFSRIKVIQYMVGEHGPFQLEIPAKDFTSAKAAALLDEQAAHVLQLAPPA
jgi:hypothetical protein